MWTPGLRCPVISHTRDPRRAGGHGGWAGAPPPPSARSRHDIRRVAVRPRHNTSITATTPPGYGGLGAALIRPPSGGADRHRRPRPLGARPRSGPLGRGRARQPAGSREPDRDRQVADQEPWRWHQAGTPSRTGWSRTNTLVRGTDRVRVRHVFNGRSFTSSRTVASFPGGIVTLVCPSGAKARGRPSRAPLGGSQKVAGSVKLRVSRRGRVPRGDRRGADRRNDPHAQGPAATLEPGRGGGEGEKGEAPRAGAGGRGGGVGWEGEGGGGGEGSKNGRGGGEVRRLNFRRPA